MRHVVLTSEAPVSTRFSQAVKAGGFVFVSGMTGIDPQTGRFDGETLRSQATRALSNCEAVLRAAGASLDDVVEVQVLLAHPEDFADLDDVFAGRFALEPPARSVARLGPSVPGLRVSVRMVAWRP